MLSINCPLKWEKYINVLEAIINQPRGNQAALVKFQPELWEAMLRFESGDMQQPHGHLLLLLPPSCIPWRWGWGPGCPRLQASPRHPSQKRAIGRTGQTFSSRLRQCSPSTPHTWPGYQWAWDTPGAPSRAFPLSPLQLSSFSQQLFSPPFPKTYLIPFGCNLPSPF